MTTFKAAKPCSFGGQRYIIGDTIPGEFIDPNRAGTLAKIGVIQIHEEPDPVEPAEITPENANTQDTPENGGENTETPPEAPTDTKPEEQKKKTGTKAKQGKKAE